MPADIAPLTPVSLNVLTGRIVLSGDGIIK
jgi:hypothetical protein